MIYDCPPKIFVPAKPAIIRAAADHPVMAMPFAPGWRSRAGSDASLYTAIQDAGATSTLVYALDAGVSASYSGGQTWNDLSGLGNSFFRGTTSSAEASDPTHNGTPGAGTASEHFSSDGDDCFTFNTSNIAAFNNMHKDNAAFTLFIVWWIIAGQGAIVAGTAAAVAEHGLNVRARGTDKGTVDILNGSGSALALTKDTDVALSTGMWAAFALSLSEAAGNVSFFWQNGSYMQVSSSNTFDAAYLSPSASSASYVYQIGARGNSSAPMPSGTKISQAAMWSSSLSKATLDNIYNHAAVKTRFSLP